MDSNPLDDPAFAGETVTNDAVAGETVIDNGNYGGPEGSEPREAEPEHAANDLADDQIDLDAAEVGPADGANGPDEESASQRN